MDQSEGMGTVLGRASVLSRAAVPDRRLARRDGVEAGLAAFIPLYGPRAEFAVALRDPTDLALADELVEELAWMAHLRGIDTLRAELEEGQDTIARRFAGGRIFGGGLHLATARTMPAGWDPGPPPAADAQPAADYGAGAGVEPDDRLRHPA